MQFSWNLIYIYIYFIFQLPSLLVGCFPLKTYLIFPIVWDLAWWVEWGAGWELMVNVTYQDQDRQWCRWDQDAQICREREGAFRPSLHVLYDDRVIQNSYMGINTFFSIFCFKRVWDYDSYNHLILFHGIISSLFWNVNLSLKAQLQPTYSRQYLPQSWIITVWLSVPPIP